MKGPAALLFLIAASAAFGADNSSDRVKVYTVRSGMTAPVLEPAPFLEETGASCKDKFRSQLATDVSFIIDAQGHARNLYFAEATGSNLDKMALRLASADRFSPAMLDGKPVATWAILEIVFEVCIDRKKVKGSRSETYRLISAPRQTLKRGMEPYEEAVFAGMGSPEAAEEGHAYKVGGNVIAPHPIVFPQAEFSEDARRRKISGVCVVTLVVDAQGMPQAARVVRSLYPSLDQKALDAVSRYRFKPAMKAGLQPIPVTISVEVSFRLY